MLTELSPCLRCLIFSVRSWKCREIKPIRNCLNWRKVRIFIIFFSFLIPVCPGFATFKKGKVHHWGRASFRLIFKWECFSASLDQTNVKFSSCISSIQSAPERDKCPGDPVPDWAFLQGECWSTGCQSVLCFFFVLFHFVSFAFLSFPFLSFLSFLLLF